MISARLKQNRKVGGRGRKRAGGSSHGMSSLIPMIDMLMILVVYLLVHAADYEILPNTRSIQIPQSMSETKPRETVTVLITKHAMFVNGAEIASVEELRRRQDAVIEPLRRVLVAEAGKRMLKDKDDPTSHEVTVLADKDLPYSFLKTILSTCTAAEYGKVSLAVLERERAHHVPGAAWGTGRDRPCRQLPDLRPAVDA
jgi:biopolymer transport protein TolR